jgi:hypothetical protein
MLPFIENPYRMPAPRAWRKDSLCLENGTDKRGNMKIKRSSRRKHAAAKAIRFDGSSATIRGGSVRARGKSSG